ncbi:MAG: hypothetical protein UU86_C0032G0005 [candidate division WWE3 bacterium GW2011_GWC1_42_102]|nr:MAG: hypothetical protein UU86_C0032G0005 [candidate division WWE3 bacterium GW2011_GWC1_42_102]
MESPNSAKKFIFFLILLTLLGGAGYYAYTKGLLPDFLKKKEVPVEQPVEEQVSVFEPVAEPILLPPTSISIKERNISADIVEVGLQTDGTLGTNAHFDDNLGRPAAFWQLKNATVGDTVLLEDSLGRLYAYQIVDSFLVDINDPDRLAVLKDTEGKSELTLITCGGIWLPGKSTYDKRLVVKAELIESL